MVCVGLGIVITILGVVLVCPQEDSSGASQVLQEPRFVFLVKTVVS